MENEKKTQEFICDEDPEIVDSNAARRIKGLGEDRINQHESQFHGRKIGWLENFWYQHKWHAGIIAFFALAAIVAIVQFATKVTPDAYLIYTGPAALVGERFERLEDALTYVIEDSNEDGKIKVTMADNTYLSPAQIEEKLKLQNNSYFDYGSNSAAYERFMTTIAACEHLLCFLDPAIHNDYAKVESFVPLSEIFGEDIPDCAYGEYGIRLGDTAFYDYFKDISFLPADTVISVRTITLDPSEKKQASQERHIEILRKIVEFDPESIEE